MKEDVVRARGAVAVVLLAWCAGAAPVALGSYDVDTSKTSVSGISSGGYMAQQFHVAYSSVVSGVRVLAGGQYTRTSRRAGCSRPRPLSGWLWSSRASRAS
jgi:poly(3-hydroxybutyrate) depolymerase